MARSRKNDSSGWTEQTSAIHDESPLAMHRRHAVKVKKPDKINNSLWGFLVVILFGGAALYALWSKASWAPPFEYYNIGRWVFFSAIWLLIILDAFQNNFLAGLLSLLVPPFTVIQGLMNADSSALRGICLALFTLVVAEFFLINDQSMVVEIQAYGNGIVTDVQRLLSREDW